PSPKPRLVPVILEPGRAQALEAVLVDRTLPGQELVDGELIPLASLFQAQETATHGGNHLGLAADDPAFGVTRRKVGDRERTAVRPDDITRARSELLVGHDTRYSP